MSYFNTLGHLPTGIFLFILYRAILGTLFLHSHSQHFLHICEAKGLETTFRSMYGYLFTQA